MDIKREWLKKVDKKKANSFIINILTILLFVIFIIFPERLGIGGVYSLKTTYILMIISMISIIYMIVNFKIKKVKPTVLTVLMMVYVLIISLSCIFSKYNQNTFLGTGGRGEGLLMLLSYLFIYYIFYKQFKFNNSIFNIITIAVVGVCAFGIVQALIGSEFGFGYVRNDIADAQYMAVSTMQNPNFFSSFICMFLPIYLTIYLFSKDNNYLYIIGILFGTLVCTRTLGGYITCIVFTSILIIFYITISKVSKESIFKALKLVIMFITIFLVLNVANDNTYYKELVSENQEKEDVRNFGNNRGYIWETSFKMIKNNPWLGVGPDAYGLEVMQKYMDKEDYYFSNMLVDKAHCEYLQIAATTGVPSLMIYLSAIMIICIALIKKFILHAKNKEIFSKECIILMSVSASIFAYLLQAGGNISVTCVAPLFWAILGVGASIGMKKTIQE